MKWRTFWESAASLFRPEPRTKSADGLTERYEDAMRIMRRFLANKPKPVSRRRMEDVGISQGRYTAACELLVKLKLIKPLEPGKSPELAWGVDDLSEVDKALSDWIDENRRRARQHRGYVPPLL